MRKQGKPTNTTPTKTTRPPTDKQIKIMEVKQEHPDLTTREIATLADTDHTHVIKTLQRYGIDREATEQYKTHRADVLAGLQHKLLVSVTDADIQKAPLGTKMLAAGLLFDKERAERGQATEIIDHRVMVLDLNRAIEQMRAEQGIEAEPVDNSVDIVVDKCPNG